MPESPMHAGIATMSARSSAIGKRSDGTDRAVEHSRTVLAFDYGERFIGVAVGDSELRTAHPLTTIDARSTTERFTKIGALIDEWQPAFLVVGMPSTAEEGTPHPLAPRVERFSRQLGGRFHLSVRLVDEQFTSAEAERELRSAGTRGARRKQNVHPQAARLILESYFNDVAA